MSQGKRKKYRRLILKRYDDIAYLNRWGFGFKHFATIMLHRMDGPDPGIDLHDHPWWFVTIPLWGGYVEERNNSKLASLEAKLAEEDTLAGKILGRGWEEVRKPFHPRIMRLDECHTIVKLRKKTAWSLVIAGPVKKKWGFYPPRGWVERTEYEYTKEGLRRGLVSIKPND